MFILKPNSLNKYSSNWRIYSIVFVGNNESVKCYVSKKVDLGWASLNCIKNPGTLVASRRLQRMSTMSSSSVEQ